MGSFAVCSPDSFDELLKCLRAATPKSKILAGGTDLVIQIREKKYSPDVVIDLSRLGELKFIKEEASKIRIGSLTNFTTIAESPVIKKYALCLAQAAAGVGSVQIRNSGTIGGNVANASPAADSIPALVALGAEILIAGPEGSRAEKIEDFLLGVEKTTLKPDEVITEIAIPRLQGNYRSAFCKLGRRKALAIARINLAVVVRFNDGGDILEEMRIGLGAVGSTAFRPLDAEKKLTGRNLDNLLLDEMALELSRVVEEKIAGRASMPYKKEAIKGLVYEAGEMLKRK